MSRERVVQCALGWMGTPYRHRQRVKGVGVDCAQILAAVYEEAGVIAPIDLGDYPVQWHLHHERELYLEWLAHAGAWRIEGDPLPGDIGVWKFGLTHSHGGIVIEGGPDPLVLHSFIKARRGVTLCRAASEQPLAGSESVQYWRIIP